MKFKIQNFSSWYNEIVLIPTIVIALPNPVRYLDIDFEWLWIYVGIRFEKPTKSE